MLDQPFAFKFEKSLKEARVAAAKSGGPGAVAAARDDVAIVNFIEDHAKTLNKMFLRSVYMFECAQKEQYGLQNDTRDLLSVLAQSHDDKDAALKLLTQFLGPQQATLLMDRELPGPEAPQPDGDANVFALRDTLHHFLGAGEPMVVQQSRASAILARDVTRKTWDTATRKLVPVLPEVSTTVRKRSGMSDTDRYAASAEAKRLRADDTSAWSTQRRGHYRGGNWQTHRNYSQHNEHGAHDRPHTSPPRQQSPKGKGRAGAGKGRGRGRGKGSRGKGKGKGKG